MSRLLPRRSSVEEPEERGPRLVDIDEDAADEVFTALSSATARSILAALYEEPRTASDLAATADTSLQNVRYHLDKLDDAGLVTVVDAWYSERGTEMPVYAPIDDSLVVFAGGESGGSLRAALASLLGGVGVLGLASAVSHQLVRTFRPSWFGGSSGSPGGSSAPSDGAATPGAGITTGTATEGTPGTDAVATVQEATGTSQPSHGGVETTVAPRRTPTRGEPTAESTRTVADESETPSAAVPEATPDPAPETPEGHDPNAMATRTDSGTGSGTPAEPDSEAVDVPVDGNDGGNGGGGGDGDSVGGGDDGGDGSGDRSEDSGGDGRGDRDDGEIGGSDGSGTENGGGGGGDGGRDATIDGSNARVASDATPDAGESVRPDTAVAADTTRRAESRDTVTVGGNDDSAGTDIGGGGADSQGPVTGDGGPSTDVENATDGGPSGANTETAVDPIPTPTPATNTSTTTTPPAANTTTRTATAPTPTATPVENTTPTTNATTTTPATPIGNTTDATNATNASIPPTSSIRGTMETDVLGVNTRLRGSMEAFVTAETIGFAVVVLGLLVLGAWARRRHRFATERSADSDGHGSWRRGVGAHRALLLSVLLLLRLPATVVASLLIVSIGLVVAASITGLGVVALL